jgi:hypothetical protein
MERAARAEEAGNDLNERLFHAFIAPLVAARRPDPANSFLTLMRSEALWPSGLS